jgi:hypothetical protein
MGAVASVCQPSTLRMLIWPEASNAQNSIATYHQCDRAAARGIQANQVVAEQLADESCRPALSQVSETEVALVSTSRLPRLGQLIAADFPLA